MSTLAFPPATQPQIVRSNQKDIYYVSYLREQLEVVLRSFMGTRWLNRWDKEVELLSRLLYFSLTIGRGSQTFGEEYVGVWQLFDSRQRPSAIRRAALILLPTLPPYLLARLASRTTSQSAWAQVLKALPSAIETISELNLAAFYISGKYYDVIKRGLGIRYVSTIKPDPNTRPPSYSFLGVLLAIRILYKLSGSLSTLTTTVTPQPQPSTTSSSEDLTQSLTHMLPRPSKDTYVDSTPVSSLVGHDPSDDPRPEIDDYTVLDVDGLSEQERSMRRCTLCLEERTASCVTECGHTFCWTCIVGWGREKAECPLCRQTLLLSRLIPLYNL